MHVQKQLFAERLSRASEELKEQGERGSPPRPALRLPPALRLRAESSRPPPSLPPTRCLSTPPSATSCPHPTPPGSVCLPGTSASPPSHPRAACNRSCDLPFKLEVINCANCRAHLLTCRDPTLCPGWTQQTLLWAGSLCITLALAVVAGDGTFSGTRSRQKRPASARPVAGSGWLSQHIPQ
ncbi:PREDICTED: uncharacterized protein LOC102263139 isoform X6 [Myotis brandtii]|uniref:uncharacterized protein LOC102263139 isoform X6 n=1 Tax=Myotis brandtii TaxID=109478 RepID=UPI00070467EF|nr:PREDICTED: uncharacterized protein LOC102263139 isoform X6 [Myotis brandtii]